MWRTLPILLLCACKGGNQADDTGFLTDDTGVVGDDSGDTDTNSGNPGPLGWIGSPCETTADCDYADAVCLDDGDGFPGGTCTQVCDLICDDRAGHPTTFCVSNNDLPPAAQLGDGMCLSQCDLGEWPNSGCRDDYGCARVSRANQPETERFACIPNATTELSECHFDLAARGVSFEPTIIADSSPASHPSLQCHVEDPVRLKPPLHGVDVLYSNDSSNSNVTAACDMAHSLLDTIDDVASRDAVALRHLGTYNCRVISGTNTLSQHSFGDAIDISGFDMAGGQRYTLEGDWDTEPGASFLYDSAYRWFDEGYWNIILTPNYNAAHYNHFHVDLTPGGDYIGGDDWRYIGPAPYND